MKYRVFDVDNKAEYTKEMSFDELKDFFEPDIEIFGEEMHDKWENADDVDDIREFLEYKADGMRVEDGIEVIPDDMDILLEDNCTKAEAKKYLETGTTIYRDLEEGLEGYCEEWDSCCADDGYSDMVREMYKLQKVKEACKIGTCTDSFNRSYEWIPEELKEELTPEQLGALTEAFYNCNGAGKNDKRGD